MNFWPRQTPLLHAPLLRYHLLPTCNLLHIAIMSFWGSTGKIYVNLQKPSIGEKILLLAFPFHPKKDWSLCLWKHVFFNKEIHHLDKTKLPWESKSSKKASALSNASSFHLKHGIATDCSRSEVYLNPAFFDTARRKKIELKDKTQAKNSRKKLSLWKDFSSHVQNSRKN